MKCQENTNLVKIEQKYQASVFVFLKQ